jgi:hypothetical protein
MYDLMVQLRQDKIMATAKQTNAIVSTFFPSNVRDRILKEAHQQVDREETKQKKRLHLEMHQRTSSRASFTRAIRMKGMKAVMLSAYC